MYVYINLFTLLKVKKDDSDFKNRSLYCKTSFLNGIKNLKVFKNLQEYLEILKIRI